MATYVLPAVHSSAATDEQELLFYATATVLVGFDMTPEYTVYGSHARTPADIAYALSKIAGKERRDILVFNSGVTLATVEAAAQLLGPVADGHLHIHLDACSNEEDSVHVSLLNCNNADDTAKCVLCEGKQT